MSPVSALDVSIQAQILNLMRSLQERHDLTYIVISHDLAVVKYLADTIGVMYLGKLVEIGPAEEVYAHAAHPYTQGLIDTIPVPDPAVAKARRASPMQGELPSAMSPPSGCRFRTRCPFAQERCAVEEPTLRLFGTGHHAACHFPLQTPLDEDQVPRQRSLSASTRSQRRCSRTSRLSRRASPMKLKATTVSTMAIPAGYICHQ